MARLPRWAQRLMEQHPGAEMPTADNPIPAWLEEEAKKRPLWYTIREAKEVRTGHPYLVYDELIKQPNQWAEILEQPEQVIRMADLLRQRDIREVIFTGCGSAFFTALHGAYTFERFTGIRTRAVESYELVHYFPPVDRKHTAVIAHSGTGGSIETVEAIRVAKQHGLLALAITNTDVSPVLDEAHDAMIYLTHQGCGPCISVVSTRILMQTMLARQLARPDVDTASIDASLQALPAAGREFMATYPPIVEAFAKATSSVESFFLVGSGPNYFTAREGTLKLEEQSLLVGKAYRTGDFHHDALSLLSPTRLVIAVAAAGPANQRLVDVLRAAREGLCPTLAVEYGNVRGLAAYADHAWHIPGDIVEDVAPILLTLPFQMLGYFMGVVRGKNPDTLATDKLSNARAWLTAFPLGTH
ncbi:MAG TPA: SIS domain-containing protein [Symbiobacteriaceae bacterium]